MKLKFFSLNIILNISLAFFFLFFSILFFIPFLRSYSNNKNIFALLDDRLIYQYQWIEFFWEFTLQEEETAPNRTERNRMVPNAIDKMKPNETARYGRYSTVVEWMGKRIERDSVWPILFLQRLLYHLMLRKYNSRYSYVGLLDVD